MRLHETSNVFENSQKYLFDFVKWWADHSYKNTMLGLSMGEMPDIDTIKNHPNSPSVTKFLSKISVNGDNDGFFINCDWNINVHDNTISRLPFRFNKVSNMRIIADNLTTLEGAPRYCSSFCIETLNGTSPTNTKLTSLEHGPQHASHLSFELASPLKNLKLTMASPIESLWVHAPSIESFEGPGVHCHELTCIVPEQRSISGIHKQLSNVEMLGLVLPLDFDGGILGLALVKGLRKIVRATPNRIIGGGTEYEKGFMLINKSKAEGWDIHELQEQMIDAGLGKFARL